VNDIGDLITILRDELGLPVGPEDAQRSLDELPGWDSVHTLWLITALERAGSHVTLPDLLEATSLRQIYEKAADL
jgi:acyl carrier protein